MKRKTFNWLFFIIACAVLTLAITYTILGPCEFWQPFNLQPTECTQQGAIL